MTMVVLTKCKLFTTVRYNVVQMNAYLPMLVPNQSQNKSVTDTSYKSVITTTTKDIPIVIPTNKTVI